MYDSTFFYVVWGVMYALILPIIFFAIIGIVYEALSSDDGDKKHSIEKLNELISDKSLDLESVEKLLDEFLEEYENFDNGEKIEEKMEFIYRLALVESFDIESSNKLKDRIISKNPKSKVDIEKRFAQAFKERDK